ncbi:MAG: heat-shock protein Hsp20 [Candidatus Magasanikbacteria bacterium CG_4_10_14_0_2_um_filter_37_12]|uniref:Heat-shock protein Hsp20 n=1 Tax=Candidatus Magasanikbacteria bacterium CG_4_10_14_0_2_um_filter_37_12 TaxID=1974637 RepID=A0A2M7V7T2_9BACT|nr:MAG: heat-shock protein Hsp20 [Candidatus Magasanikbacteria bacterium CG_4_10_14_0_2_um_filter_37_12]
MLPKMWDPFQEMEEMMNRLPALAGMNMPTKGFVPAMDVYETKDAVVVETTLAGVRPEDVEVRVENGLVTIQGETNKEREVEEKNYYRKEVRSGSFFRQVPLPVAVDEEKVKAEFDGGVLKITCPKAGKKVDGKKIEIEVKKKK